MEGVEAPKAARHSGGFDPDRRVGPQGGTHRNPLQRRLRPWLRTSADSRDVGWPSPVRAGGTAAGLAAPLRAWGAAVFAHLRARWHQSLQLRVVGTTLAVSALLVT